MRKIVATGLLLFSQLAFAEPVQWTIQNGIDNFGLEVSGSFVFDADVADAWVWDWTPPDDPPPLPEVPYSSTSVFFEGNGASLGDSDVVYCGHEDCYTPYSNEGFLWFTAYSNGPSFGLYEYRFSFAEDLTNAGGEIAFTGRVINPEVLPEPVTFSGTLIGSAVVPVPAAIWLFGSALIGLGWLRRPVS